METKLIISSSPHIHSGDNIEKNMYGVLIALIPAFLVSLVYFGLGALMVVFILDTIDYFVAGIKNVKPEEELRKQQEKALLAESKI